MSIANQLLKIGIIPIRPFNFNEVYQIGKKIIELLNNAFPTYDIKNDDILRKIFRSKMYFAKISPNLGKASYFYKNSAIYIDEKVDINNLDEFVLHEIMHYLQEEKDEKGKLIKIGICTFKEFKIYGFAINEAAIQYVISKMLNRDEEIIDFFGIEIKTNNKYYYPLLSNLISQIVHIIGENTILDGIFKSNNNIENEINKYYGYEEYNQIQKKFDYLLDIRQKLKMAIEKKNNIEKEQISIKLKKSFLDTQKYLYTRYFDYYIELIDDISEVDKIKADLNAYSQLIQTDEGRQEYNEYVQNMMKRIDKKSILIYRKNSKNSIAVINNSKIQSILRFIKNIFIKDKLREEEILKK